MAEVKLEQTLSVELPHIKEEPEPPHIKEEPEPPHIKEEPAEFPFHIIRVKSEFEEDASSVLHQNPTEEKREETKGENCGAEAGCSSDPLTQFHSDSEEQTDSSDHTDHSEEWVPEQTKAPRSNASQFHSESEETTDHSEDYSEEEASEKRSYAMIPPDSCMMDRRLLCSVCGKRFRSKSHLHRHMLIHTGEKPHKCSVCEKTWRYKHRLYQHLREQHCLILSKDKTSLITIPPDAVTDHRPFSCSRCDKTFECKSKLQMHMLVHTGERPHKCSFCEKHFKQTSHIMKHQKHVHNMCPFCKTCFSDKIGLNEHLRTHEQQRSLDQSSMKPFSCSDCGKRFSKNSTLERHMFVHLLHKCIFCEKGFKVKRDLTRHMRIHTGEKPFRCTVCGKGFNQNGNLQTHMKTHSGQKPFVCSVCEKDFKIKCHLKIHMKTHTSKKPFDC